MLTNDQYKFLATLYNNGAKRTNNLAKLCGWDNQHTPHVGLQLREQGFVSSTNDGAEYNKWDVTATGRAKYLEEVALRKPKKAAPVSVPVPCEYTLFYAGSYHLRLNTEDEALNRAKAAADQGFEVTVCEVKAVAKVRRVLEVTKP